MKILIYLIKLTPIMWRHLTGRLYVFRDASDSMIDLVADSYPDTAADPKADPGVASFMYEAVKERNTRLIRNATSERKDAA